jgi:flagellar basal-body rod modification protein FlgD
MNPMGSVNKPSGSSPIISGNNAGGKSDSGMSPALMEAINGKRGGAGAGMGPAEAPIAAGGAAAAKPGLKAAGNALADANGPGAPKSGAELQNTFMRLLVTEMKNQDPTNPMDSSQMTSQLAQINTVSGIAGLNATMTSLATQLNASQQVAASGLIGKSVLSAGHDINVSKGAASAFGVQLDSAASAVNVQIMDGGGQVVRTMKLDNQPTGMNTLSWDGKNDMGAKVADGNYSFKVNAANGDDPVSAAGLAQSQVQSVIQQPNGSAGLKLLNGSTTSLSSVAQIL